MSGEDITIFNDPDTKHYKTWYDILKLDYAKLESKADSYLKQLEQTKAKIEKIKNKLSDIEANCGTTSPMDTKQEQINKKIMLDVTFELQQILNNGDKHE